MFYFEYVYSTEILLSETTFNAFPVVVSKESKRLVGLVYRKELTQALSEHF